MPTPPDGSRFGDDFQGNDETASGECSSNGLSIVIGGHAPPGPHQSARQTIFIHANLRLGMRGRIFEPPFMPHDTLDVRHIARLARLDLNDDEIATFQPQLQAVLDHVNALTNLDLDGIEPTAHPSPTFGRMRDDTPHDSLTAEAVLANAPDQSQGQIRVPKVVADA